MTVDPGVIKVLAEVKRGAWVDKQFRVPLHVQEFAHKCLFIVTPDSHVTVLEYSRKRIFF